MRSSAVGGALCNVCADEAREAIHAEADLAQSSIAIARVALGSLIAVWCSRQMHGPIDDVVVRQILDDASIAAESMHRLLVKACDDAFEAA